MSQAQDDVQGMRDQIERYGSITQFGIRVQTADGEAHSQADTGYLINGFNGMSGSWQLGNWGDTLTFVPNH